MRSSLRIPLYFIAPVFAVVYSYVAIRYFSSYSSEILLGFTALTLGALLAFTDYSRVFILLFLAIPPSIEMAIGNGDNKMLIPSEPVMVILAIAFAIQLAFRRGVDTSFLRHPVSVSVLSYLVIMTLGILGSGMPVVSLKYTLVTITYVLIFYFMSSEFMRRRDGNILLLYLLYGTALLFVATRALYLHSTTGFAHEVAGLVVHPYFIDHTIYSACLSLIFPGFVALAWKRRALGLPRIAQLLAAGFAFILCAAIFFSFSRAAWISIGAAFILFITLQLKIKPKHVGIAVLLLASGIWFIRNPIIDRMKQNHYSSTDRSSDLAEQTMSVGNISNDASNAERLNRWSCALRMFLDKPITGFGPGTYQFEYLGYQRADEMTRISVTTAYNNIYGRGGSAHSEYLLALSEMGIGGFIAFVCIVIFTVGAGMRAYYNAADEKSKILAAMALLGFFTYIVHANFNNFLNNNKPASFFWILIAIIVLMDVRTRPAKESKSTETQFFGPPAR
jgi:O-antigen ligase